MRATEIYLILMIVFLTICIIKKMNYMGVFLIVLYTIEAGFSVLLLKDGTFNAMLSLDKMSIWPYFLLIVSYILYFWPFLERKNAFQSDGFEQTLNRKYVVFAYLYILMAFITLLCCLPTLISMIQAGNWAQTYGEASVLPYNNHLEYFATNFCDYFRVLAVLVGFSMMRKKECIERNYTPYILIATAVATALSDAILSTSRSMIFEIGLLVLVVYIFFYKNVEKNKKRFISIIAIIALGAILALFMSITVSRFESRGTNTYMLSYLGQAPIVFNTQIVGSINKLSWGYFEFGRLFDSTPFNQTIVGGMWGQRFYMFVGWIYLDWGVIGVFCGGIIIALIFGKVVAKKSYQMSDLYLLFSLMLIYLKGVFVIGRSYCLNIVATLLIYLILRVFFEKYTFRIGKLEI